MRGAKKVDSQLQNVYSETVARPREFEPEQALEQALHVFGEKGYADTSFEDIVKATNVSRYGLYGVFGNKRELFRKVLRQYADLFVHDYQAELRKPDASLPQIREYFETLLLLGDSMLAGRGCMICNTAVEVAPHDAEIAAEIRTLFGELVGVFRGALQNAHDNGDISPELSVDHWAVNLALLTQSSAVMARVGIKMATIKKSIEAALSALGSK